MKKVTIPLNLTKGEYDVKTKFVDEIYKSTLINSRITVDYIGVLLTASDVNMNYNDKSTYFVRLTDVNQKPLANETLNIYLNNIKTPVVTDENGVATLLITLPPNTYTISTEYEGNNIYDKLTINNKITVKSLAKLKGNNVNMYYSEKAYYKVRVYGDDGKVVGSGISVKIKVNGKTITAKTNAKGYASYKINLIPKTYTVKVTYKKVQITNKIVVKKVLSAKNISKKKAKKIKFTAKLAKGKKALANKKIKFKFKGKTYTAKTNKKGIASVSLKNLKVGKYTIYTYYGSSKIKNTIKIKK